MDSARLVAWMWGLSPASPADAWLGSPAAGAIAAAAAAAMAGRQGQCSLAAPVQMVELPQRFSSVIPHLSSPRLFSAFYVCRSWCEAHSFHTDYMRPVGLHALTLITPLRDYQETDSFQLTYKPAVASGVMRVSACRPTGRM